MSHLKIRVSLMNSDAMCVFMCLMSTSTTVIFKSFNSIPFQFAMWEFFNDSRIGSFVRDTYWKYLLFFCGLTFIKRCYHLGHRRPHFNDFDVLLLTLMAFSFLRTAVTKCHGRKDTEQWTFVVSSFRGLEVRRRGIESSAGPRSSWNR